MCESVQQKLGHTKVGHQGNKLDSCLLAAKQNYCDTLRYVRLAHISTTLFSPI